MVCTWAELRDKITANFTEEMLAAPVQIDVPDVGSFTMENLNLNGTSSFIAASE